MKRVLLTGGTGLIGRNILPILSEENEVFAPSRSELVLGDVRELEQYIEDHGVEVIVHSANPNPVKSVQFDSAESFFEDSMRLFMAIYSMRTKCEKIIYIGSGAEYGKNTDIVQVAEDGGAPFLPLDSYGFAKYIMNELAACADNVINLCVFGCYGDYDHESKFITHCIRSVLADKDITIRQDCRFDYLRVEDLGRTVNYFINHPARFSRYNVATGKIYLLSEIAQKVLEQMESDRAITILTPGLNKEYTACVDRLQQETGLVDTFIDIDEGIALQIEHEKSQCVKRG